MIKRNGQRVAAIAMAVALMGQNIPSVFALDNLTENEAVTLENNAVESEVIVEETTTEELTEEVQDENSKSNEATIDFKIMATSDLHANLMNYDYYTGSTTNNSGLVKAATVIKEQKALANKSENSSVDNVLLVDNGNDYRT